MDRLEVRDLRDQSVAAIPRPGGIHVVKGVDAGASGQAMRGTLGRKPESSMEAGLHELMVTRNALEASRSCFG